MQKIDGVLILDKPEGISSNQALQKAKRIFGAKKAGHTGSLDVLATGLLPVCFGQATKFSQFLLDSDKTYRVTGALGERTSTGDGEGDVIEKHEVTISSQQLCDVLKSFEGKSKQVPPMHSALKHRGQPLYKLARKGIEVARKARDIMIYQLDLLDWQGDSFTLDVKCSKGTYIRSLIDDIGLKLECGAHVSSLRRLAAGPFDAGQMLSLEKLETIKEQGDHEALIERLLPADCLLDGVEKIELEQDQVAKLQHGQKVSAAKHKGKADSLVRVFYDGEFQGLAQVDSERVLKAKRMFASS